MMAYMKTSQKQHQAKDIFSHLFMIVVLYVGIISFLAMLFQMINVAFPDVLTLSYTYASDSLRVAISALLIVWPAYLGINYLILRDLHKQKAVSAIRKWLLYLTLFLAGITIVVDLIVLTNTYLGGSLTSTFVLKVLAVLLVAVAVFGYHLWELRREIDAASRIPKIFGVTTSLIIVLGIVLGFVIVGSPAEQRDYRFDEERVQDLSNIQYGIAEYWSSYGELPEMLDDISGLVYDQDILVDPESQVAYEYTVTGEMTYDICATFSRPSQFDTYSDNAVRSPYGYYNADWTHEAGTQCFTREIDPELYKFER